MAATPTNRLKYLLASGGIVPGTTDVRMGLLTAISHASIPDANFVSDLAGAGCTEVTTGAVASYARQALTGEAASEVDASDKALIDCDDVAFGALETGATVVGYFLYVYNASDAAAALLGVVDLTSTPTNGSTFTVTTASGIIELT